MTPATEQQKRQTFLMAPPAQCALHMPEEETRKRAVFETPAQSTFAQDTVACD